MSAFWKKSTTEEQSKSVSKTAKDKIEAKKGKKPVKAKAIKANKDKAELYSRVILMPVISENAMNHQVLNKYVFQVATMANKSEISKSIEALYGVTVESVNTVRYKPAKTSFRFKSGQSKGYKKAIVSLEKGQSIDLFSDK